MSADLSNVGSDGAVNAVGGEMVVRAVEKTMVRQAKSTATKIFRETFFVETELGEWG